MGTRTDSRTIIARVSALLRGDFKARVTIGDGSATSTRSAIGVLGGSVRGMWLMLQQDRPGDNLVATGEAHSVRECLEVAFDADLMLCSRC